jgi:alpha-ketoglutaric semialdehyde dehydrogenase
MFHAPPDGIPMSSQPLVLLNGEWRASAGSTTFQAVNPRTGESLPGVYPLSPWSEVQAMIQAAAQAFELVRAWPGSRFAAFLEDYATRIEAAAPELVAMAHAETGLPVEPRLSKAELPRTTNQLRQAARAAREGSWLRPVIDTAANIRSVHAPLGPVVVFGPNNFPFAFNGMAGGDFAAAVAAGCPVIAKGHSSHPGTTRLFAELALAASVATGMPPGFVQVVYRLDHADGEKLVSHPLVGAIGYTGARETGLVLKAAADRVGKPIYVELSSINPVVILPGALAERGVALADEYVSSVLMGTGQFCTNPGLLLMYASDASRTFVTTLAEKFAAAPVGTLLSAGVLRHLESSVATIQSAGARPLCGGTRASGSATSHANTLFLADGKTFLTRPQELQTEAFGNVALVVLVEDDETMGRILASLEGNLTGTIYSAADGSDDDAYGRIEPALRQCVGRLLNDKMPTGVAVSPAMNHGGPFPATGHPGFTAVGLPAAILRFTKLDCYDAVRENRLPPALRNENPGGVWRSIDGVWTTGNVGA